MTVEQVIKALRHKAEFARTFEIEELLVNLANEIEAQHKADQQSEGEQACVGTST